MNTTSTTRRSNRKRYTVGRGAYYGTTDDRADRWYVEDRESRVVDRRGPGYRTREEARREADWLNRRVDA